MRAALGRLKLSRYLTSMLEHGYDDWGEIIQMGKPKLNKLVRKVCMAENHADRFREAVEAEAKAKARAAAEEGGGLGAAPVWTLTSTAGGAAFSRAPARGAHTNGRQPKHRREPSRYSSRRVARAFGRFSMVAQRPRNLSTELLVGFSARKHLQFQSN